MMAELQRRSKDRRDTGTRERLVDAAQRCVRAHGIAQTSSRAIADAADANLGSITYYFGSKEHLLAVALADELHDWMQPVLDLLAGSGDPATRLFDAVNALNTTFEEQPDRAPGLLEVFVHASRDPDPRNPVAHLWADLRTRLVAVITELRSSGAVPGWVAPDAMAAVILAVGAGTVISATVEPAGVNHRDIAAQFASLLLAAASGATRAVDTTTSD